MIFVMLALVVLANVYVVVRIWQILPFGTAGKIAIVALWVLLFAGSIAGIAKFWDKLPLPLGAFGYEVCNTWMIAFLYLLIAFLILDLGRLCHLVPVEFMKASAPGSVVVFGIIGVILLAGNIHYGHKYREQMEIVTDKVSEPLKIVMASDLHLGYHNRRPELARWVDMINAEKPDMVLIGGDIVDMSLKPVLEWDYAAEFRRIEAPVYTVLGNHEYYGDKPGAEKFFSESGITLLKDSVATCKGLWIVGRDDRTNPRRKSVKDLLAAKALLEVKDLLDKEPQYSLADDGPGILPGNQEFTILLDHQPYHLEEAQEAGIDFQFSGHTHRGQVWPLNWITDAIYEKSWGAHQRGDTRYYISSGLGIWGAKIRIGTRSEYLVLTLSPKE